MVEIDRGLLSAPPPPASSRLCVENPAADVRRPVADGGAPPEAQAANRGPRTSTLDFVFLHDGPLSSGGVEMMGKIVAAMKHTPDTAPVVFAGERPAAKIYVVLGSKAMKMWYPGMRGSPGQWLRGRGGEDVLVTYSPEYILRFGAVTPALTRLKREMWTSLKGVLQRVGG